MSLLKTDEGKAFAKAFSEAKGSDKDAELIEQVLLSEMDAQRDLDELMADPVRDVPAAHSVVPDLDWTENTKNGVWTVETIVGEYSVGFDDGWWAELYGPTCWEWALKENPRSFSGPSAAMAAAQADYEARITAALSPAFVKSLAALRVAARDLEEASSETINQWGDPFEPETEWEAIVNGAMKDLSASADAVRRVLRAAESS